MWRFIFLSSRMRYTSYRTVTGVQSCALPFLSCLVVSCRSCRVVACRVVSCRSCRVVSCRGKSELSCLGLSALSGSCLVSLSDVWCEPVLF